MILAHRRSAAVTTTILRMSTQAMVAVPSAARIAEYVKTIYDLSNMKNRNLISAAITGGGCSVVQSLLTVPGASQCIQSVRIPYGRSACIEMVNSVDSSANPASFCTVAIAAQLSEAAFKESLKISLADQQILFSEAQSGDANIQVIGIGCTAALVSAAPRRGTHRCHISIRSSHREVQATLILDKGIRSRQEEDAFCGAAILSLLGEFLSLPPLFAIGHELTDYQTLDLPLRVSVDRLITNQTQSILLLPNSSKDITKWQFAENCPLPHQSVICSGSFNPLHEGHVRMSLAAARCALQHDNMLTMASESQLLPLSSSESQPFVVFELAIVNADKPTLSIDELFSRLAQFHHSTKALSHLFAQSCAIAVCLTRKPLYVEKSKLFRGINARFVVGTDTLRRIADVNYYLPSDAEHAEQESMMAFAAMISSLDSDGSRLCVCGRLKDSKQEAQAADNPFESLSSLMVETPSLRWASRRFPRLFVEVPESEFRVDLSSTILRRRSHSN